MNNFDIVSSYINSKQFSKQWKSIPTSKRTCTSKYQAILNGMFGLVVPDDVVKACSDFYLVNYMRLLEDTSLANMNAAKEFTEIWNKLSDLPEGTLDPMECVTEVELVNGLKCLPEDHDGEEAIDVELASHFLITLTAVTMDRSGEYPVIFRFYNCTGTEPFFIRVEDEATDGKTLYVPMDYYSDIYESISCISLPDNPGVQTNLDSLESMYLKLCRDAMIDYLVPHYDEESFEELTGWTLKDAFLEDLELVMSDTAQDTVQLETVNSANVSSTDTYDLEVVPTEEEDEFKIVVVSDITKSNACGSTKGAKIKLYLDDQAYYLDVPRHNSPIEGTGYYEFGTWN